MYYLNGKIYENEPAGNDFFYGYSLFETMYGLNGEIIFFEEHMNRLYEAAKKIGLIIKFDIKDEVLNFIKRKDELVEFMVKIQVSENNLYIKVQNFEGRDFPQGIKAEFVKDYYQNEMGYIKSGNYLGNILAKKNLNTIEGIFTNREGYITEGTISNVFFIKNNIIFTPSLDLNILPGITRGKIIELAKKNEFVVQEGRFTKKDLLEADGIFFTNSLMKRGVLWVSEFEKTNKIKTKEIHKLEKEYLKIVGYMI